MRFTHFFILLPLISAISESSSPVLDFETIAANAAHTRATCVYRKELNSDVTIEAIVRQAEQGKSIEQLRSQQPELLFFALMQAISDHKSSAIVPLIRAGADLNGIEDKIAGRTPLMKAASRSPAITRILLAHGAWPNVHNNDKETALICAIDGYGGLAMIQLLLNHGADPRIKSDRNLTALHYALKVGSDTSIAIAQLLLDYEVTEQIDQNGASLLDDTQTTKTPLKIAWLARHGASVNNVHTGYSETLLQIARKTTTPSEALQGYVLTPGYRDQRLYEQIRELVARGARLPTESLDAISPAAVDYIKKLHVLRERIIRDLLTYAYDIPDDLQRLIGQFSDDRFSTQRPPLDAAILRQCSEYKQPTRVYESHQYDEAFQAVIKTLVRVAETGDYQALHTHCTDNDISSTHLFNALLHAIAKGTLIAVKTLHNLGADINGLDGSLCGYTPLSKAARCGKVDVVQYLLTHGAGPNVHTNNSPTGLREAARRPDDRHSNMLTILQLLLGQGADPWIVDEFGCTAFHCTFSEFGFDWQRTRIIAQFLLDHDAGDAEQVNYEGKGLLENYLVKRTVETIAWLATRGAPVNNVITGHSYTLARLAAEQSEYKWINLTSILQELALRGARLDPTRQDKIGPAVLSIITEAQQERCNVIAEALSPLHETSSTQRLIRQFSDDITTT